MITLCAHESFFRLSIFSGGFPFLFCCVNAMTLPHYNASQAAFLSSIPYFVQFIYDRLSGAVHTSSSTPELSA